MDDYSSKKEAKLRLSQGTFKTYIDTLSGFIVTFGLAAIQDLGHV